MGSRDRRPYETATVLNQALLDECAGNMVCDLRMIALISVPTGAFPTDTLYLSDRNMIVGENYYDARIKFPPFTRNITEILTPEITFSSITLEINNVDSRFNPILPAGAFYSSFINRRVVIKIGLAEAQATYDANVIFDGFVTEVGGFSRDTASFKIVARDRFDSLKTVFPTETFTTTEYPLIGDSVKGKFKPFILGDWTTNVEAAKGASVPAYVVNGADTNMNGELSFTNNVRLVISSNFNRYFNPAKVVLLRSDLAYTFNAADIVNVAVGNHFFEIRQLGGVTLIDGAPFQFKQSDKIFVSIKGLSIDVGDVYADNAVEQAKYILNTYGHASVGDFTTMWATLRDKSSPPQSSIFTIKSRLHQEKQIGALEVALSLLEQVRTEAFINRAQKIQIQTLHWEDFNASPSIVIRDFDIEEGSFKPAIDERINYTKLIGFFNLLPDINEEYQSTQPRQNAAAIASHNSKVIPKGLTFPNLFIASDVLYQTDEYLKLTSGGKENITCNQTWRTLTLDLGDWVLCNFQIQSIQFVDVPLWIRSIGFNSVGMKLTFNYFSFQMLPFGAWNPGYTGIVGGETAVITDG